MGKKVPMITVQVRSYVKEIIGKPWLEVEVEEGIKVKELLIQLIERDHGPMPKKALLNPETGEIYPPYGIFINGEGIFRLPDGIHTSLRDGDVVSILVLLSGG